MPKSPHEHDYDKLATTYLKRVFPLSWKFIRPADVDSGIEYGDDLLIKIVDEDSREPTGAEFIVQNKCNPIEHIEYVSIVLKTDTLFYLRKLNKPILIHGYDIQSEVGYWIWLSEWHDQNYKERWRNQKTVTIQIPKQNLLDIGGVEKIRSYAENRHRHQYILAEAESISRTDPDFRITTSSEGSKVEFQITPKHDNPRRPKLVPSDKKSLEKYVKSIETGENVRISGEIRLGGRIQQFLQEIFGSIAILEVTHTLPQKEFLCNIRFLDESSQNMWESPLIRLKPAKVGTKKIKLHGRIYDPPFALTLIVDERNTEENINLNIDFQFNDAYGDPIKLDQYLDVFSMLSHTHSVEFENCETGEIEIAFLGEKLTQLKSSYNSRIHKFVKALAIIKTYFQVTINVPDEFTQEIFENALAISEGLTVGKTSYLLGIPQDHDILVVDFTKIDDPQQLINAVNNPDRVSVWRGGPPELEFLGHHLRVGDNCQILHFRGVNRKEELVAKLQQYDKNAPQDLSIEFVVDFEKSYTEFVDCELLVHSE